MLELDAGYDEAQTWGGVWDTRNTEGRIWDENILVGLGCAHFFIGVMWDSFEISGMRYLKCKWPFEN